MELYWWLTLSRLHEISETSIFLLSIIIFFIAVVIISSATEETKEQDSKLFSKHIKYSSVIIFLNLLIYVFTPTKSDLARS